MGSGFRKLKKKLLKHVPDEESKEMLSGLTFKQFELESSRFKDYLPLKEYTW